MDEFREALRSVVVDACTFLSAQPVVMRRWTRIIREPQGRTSFPTELRPDFSEALFHWHIRLEQNSTSSFRQMVSTAQASDELLRILLVDATGTPAPEESHEQLLKQVATRFVYLWVNRTNSVQFDEHVFQVLWDELMHDIKSPTMKVIEFSPILNLELDCPEVRIDAGVRLLELPLEELESLLNTNELIPPHQLTNLDLLRLKCAAEVVYEQDKRGDQAAAASVARTKLSQLLTAVSLLSDATPCVAYTRVRTSSWLSPGLGWHSSRPHAGSDARILHSQEPELINLFAKLTASPNAHRAALGLTRWNSAGDRPTEEDKLIDYWVALESLFGPRDQQELSFRIPFRIATFLGAGGPERLSIFHEMRDSYRLRSDIVHGSAGRNDKKRKSNNKVTASQCNAWARSYLKRALLKILLSDEKFDAEKLEIGLLSREGALHSNTEFESCAGI